MKKRFLSVCLILTMLLSMALPAFADTAADTDAAKVQEGYQFKVTAADGTVTYGKFGESYDGNGRDTSLLDADGKTVTLLTDVKLEKKELMLPGTYTIDGNGHTFNGGFRSETGNANVTFKNMTVVQKDEEALGGTAGLQYIYQINGGSKAVFDSCTFLPTGNPAFSHFVVRGDLTLKNCTMLNVGLPTANKDDEKDIFRMDQATSALTLTDTTITTVAESTKLSIVRFYAAGTLNLKGNTVLTSAIGKEVVINSGATPTVNKAATVIIGTKVSGDGVWDGVSFDTSWLDPANLKDSYEIDTAAKLAGLAKICKDQNKADFPSTDDKMITFYITKDIDLGGHSWTPIGETYAARFAGNIIGKKDGVEGAAVTISGLKVSGPSGKANDGFIGTSDKNSKVANLIFLNPVISTDANTCGTVIGYGRGGAILENVKVLGGTVTASANHSMIGGLVGYTKSGKMQMTDCLFVGDIVTGSEKTGGLVGYVQSGAVLKNCYAGGTLAATVTKFVGGLIGELDEDLTAEDCQFDGFVRNSGEQTGALIGLYQPAKEGSTVKLTNVLISGLSFETTTAANGFALIGKMGGEGKVKMDMTKVVTLAPMSLYTAKLDSVTLEGANVGFEKAESADVTMTAAWTAREGKYPVLTLAKDAAVNIYGMADYTWLDLTKDTLDIANLRQLVAFAAASKLYSFKGKTVRLTADIDGAALPDELKTIKTGGEMNSNLKTAFEGTFDKNGFSMTNLTFETTDDMTFTVIWDLDNGSEPTRETYRFKETPTYKGETPTHESDDVYNYEFRGWDKEIVPVTEDVIYTAKWKKIKIQKETEPETKPDTEPDTSATTEPAANDDKGCNSSVAGVLFPLCAVLAGVTVLKKRREER